MIRPAPRSHGSAPLDRCPYGGRVRLIRPLPPRWQRLAREATSFALIGGVNFLIDWAVFNAFLSIGPLKAKVVSTVVSATTSFFMNRQWTYRDRPRAALHREYILFFVFNAVGFAINEFALAVARYGLGHTSVLALNVANIVGVAAAMVFRFVTYRQLVFKDATPPTPPAPVNEQVEPATAQ